MPAWHEGRFSSSSNWGAYSTTKGFPSKFGSDSDLRNLREMTNWASNPSQAEAIVWKPKSDDFAMFPSKRKSTVFQSTFHRGKEQVPTGWYGRFLWNGTKRQFPPRIFKLCRCLTYLSQLRVGIIRLQYRVTSTLGDTRLSLSNWFGDAIK